MTLWICFLLILVHFFLRHDRLTKKTISINIYTCLHRSELPSKRWTRGRAELGGAGCPWQRKSSACESRETDPSAQWGQLSQTWFAGKLESTKKGKIICILFSTSPIGTDVINWGRYISGQKKGQISFAQPETPFSSLKFTTNSPHLTFVNNAYMTPTS